MSTLSSAALSHGFKETMPPYWDADNMFGEHRMKTRFRWVYPNKEDGTRIISAVYSEGPVGIINASITKYGVRAALYKDLLAMIRLTPLPPELVGDLVAAKAFVIVLHRMAQ